MIERVSGPRPANEVRRTANARTGGAFRIEDESDIASATAAGEVAAPSLGGMLALQEEETGGVQDRAARRHGRELLDELAGLQRDMLGGGVSRHRIGHLLDLATASPHAADPRLRDVVAAIATRAMVEIARYDRGCGSESD